MRRSDPQPETDQEPFDPRVPGKARIIYTIVVMIVVLSLVVGIAGYAFWDRIF